MAHKSGMNSVSQARKEIASAINQLLSLSATRQDGAVVDSMVYGKKFAKPEIFGVDWTQGSDSYGFTLPLCNHVCDVVITLRFGDPRVGVFLPNSIVSGFDDEIHDTLRLIVGAPKNEDKLLDVVARGFDAYPEAGSGDYPHIMGRRHEHGIYVEYCFAGSVRDLLNTGLMGEVPAALVGDALGHAAIHIIQTISAHIHLAETRDKVSRGMVESIEFTHARSSAELIRNYNLEPSQLEIVREASENQPGEYILHFMEQERERLASFIAEVIELAQAVAHES